MLQPKSSSCNTLVPARWGYFPWPPSSSGKNIRPSVSMPRSWVLLHCSHTGSISEPPGASALPCPLLGTCSLSPLAPQLLPTLQVQLRGPFLWEAGSEPPRLGLDHPRLTPESSQHSASQLLTTVSPRGPRAPGSRGPHLALFTAKPPGPSRGPAPSTCSVTICGLKSLFGGGSGWGWGWSVEPEVWVPKGEGMVGTRRACVWIPQALKSGGHS